MNIFEKASRKALRFHSNKGQLTVEDLWNLPLKTQRKTLCSLDALAVASYTNLQQTSSVSFVDSASKEDSTETLRLEILKHIINTKVEENKVALDKAQSASRKSQIMDIISRKQDAELESKSTEELLAMVKAL